MCQTRLGPDREEGAYNRGTHLIHWDKWLCVWPRSETSLPLGAHTFPDTQGVRPIDGIVRRDRRPTEVRRVKNVRTSPEGSQDGGEKEHFTQTGGDPGSNSPPTPFSLVVSVRQTSRPANQPILSLCAGVPHVPF